MPRANAGNVSAVVPTVQSVKKGMINSSVSKYYLKSKNHGSKAPMDPDLSGNMPGVDYVKPAYRVPDAFR